ncbi:MAG TPA: GGDEF domain-containing protein [Acidimicrobiales bacterium]|nr:GGDEF domain-containing protein [Acidimicrobiales bacterium]
MPPVEIRGEVAPVAGAGSLEKPESKQVATGQQPGQGAWLRAFAPPVVLAAGTALLYFTELAGRLPPGGERPALWCFVALGIWAACAQPVAVRNRRSSVSIVLTEIPALVGIVFLAPWLVLSAISFGHLAGSLQRRRPVLKAVSNLLIYVPSAAVGILFYDWAIGHSSPISPRGWAVTVGTITLINLVDLVLLLAFMAVTNPSWRRPPTRAMVLQGGVHVGICSAGALVAISLISVNTWGAVLFIAIAAAASYAYRGTILSGQRYANLEKLYEFTRRLGSLIEAQDVMATVLEEARDLLSAGYAELVIPLEEPAQGFALRCALSGEGVPHLDETSPFSSLDNIVRERGALLAGDGPKDEEALAGAIGEQGLREVLAAPLQRDDPGAGYLLVADRAFKHEGFKRTDLRFFEALAANAGVALRSSKLLEQLRREASVRQHQAQHDALTGLPNRALFAERLEEATEGAPPGSRVTVMLIDLDGFKEVNDTLGHHTGDAILREVAQRLAPLDQEGNLVARLGGDEFAVLHVGMLEDSAIFEKAEQIVATICQPLGVEGLLLDVRASLGVAVSPMNSHDATGLLRHADIAMYAAKGSGGGVRFYDRAEDRSTLRRLRLATELRQAIEQADLDVWYQPVVQLDTGAVVSCEALLRWSHDQFGPISPTEFIPVAESAGLIDQLTWWVIETALAQAKSWRQIIPDLNVAVNLSARSLMSTDVSMRLAEVLHQVGLEPSALTLELTESSAMADPQTSERVLHGLRELGVNLSIDDYGTGFSSLSRLKHLPFHELKIDRSFVKEMIRDKGDEAIVRSTIELARNLGRTVTAEGVEDQATLQRLESLGCHAVQGFFLARPLPAPQCEAWLLAASAALDNTLRVPRIGERAASHPPKRHQLPRSG